MRILKVCTHPYGGATIAAKRQAEALKAYGMACSMVFIEDMPNTDRTGPWVERQDDDFIIKVPGSMWSHHGRMTQAVTSDNRTPISTTYFSFFPISTNFDELLLDVCKNFEVIHFHWIAGMVSEAFLDELKYLEKKIVFTGHDMNHFTGGCHYSAGCDKYTTVCDNCPQLITDPLRLVEQSFSSKIAAYSSLRATWLFPSRWLERCFRSSRLGSSAEISGVLYNCVDTSRFAPLEEKEKTDKRFELGFAPDEVLLVAGSVDNNEKRKGFRYLEAAIVQLSQTLGGEQGNDRFVVITFGRGKPQMPTHSQSIRHVHMGVVDEEQVVSILQVADLFLMPSTEENFANTILESVHCGCPVLAFGIGGVPDIVEHNVNGDIVEEVTEHAYATGLIRTLRKGALSALHLSTLEWRENNAQRFSPLSIARQLHETYERVSESTVGVAGQVSDCVNPERLIYERLFGRCAPNDVHSHMLTAAGLKRHLCYAKSEGVFIGSVKPLETPTILKGFTELSEHSEQRLAGWQLQSSCAIFPFDEGCVLALCIQYYDRQDLGESMQQIRERLCIKVNGHDTSGHWVRSNHGGGFHYLWVLPEAGQLVAKRYNLVSFNFESPTVPLSADARGLCARYTAINLFDLRAVGGAMAAQVPDYRLSTALSLRGGIDQYLWERWSKTDHASHSLANDAHRWRDLLAEKA